MSYFINEEADKLLAKLQKLPEDKHLSCIRATLACVGATAGMDSHLFNECIDYSYEKDET